MSETPEERARRVKCTWSFCLATEFRLAANDALERAAKKAEAWGPEHISKIPAPKTGTGDAAVTMDLHRIECQKNHAMISSEMHLLATAIRGLKDE